MAFRKKTNWKKDKKMFSRTAGKTSKKNRTSRFNSRGGVRL